MEFLTAKEIAARLGVTTMRVYQLTSRERRIPHVRRGKRLYFPRAAWEAYEAAQVRQALANCGMGGDDAA